MTDNIFTLGYGWISKDEYNRITSKSKETEIQSTLLPIEEGSKKKRRKYPRNWSDYILSRQKEKLYALDILHDAVRILKIKTHSKGYGRPPYPLADKIFLCVQKVLRWTTYDANEEFIHFSHLKNWTFSKPQPHSISDFMNDPQITHILEQLLVLLSTPMACYEKSFAIDSTGLSTSDKSKWLKVRLDFQQHRDYKKIHCIVGTKTNVIVSAIVTHGTQSDSPMLHILIEKMSKYFKIKGFTGDGAYASRKNAQLVEDKGGTPYFKLQKRFRSLSKGYRAWNRMILDFKRNQEKYLKKYHRRSLVETTYAMFKRKASAHLKSKTDIAKVNESLCIAICHNLFCITQAVFCNNLKPEFRV